MKRLSPLIKVDGGEILYLVVNEFNYKSKIKTMKDNLVSFPSPVCIVLIPALNGSQHR